MPLHHSLFTAQIWCSTALHSIRHFYYISLKRVFALLWRCFNIIIWTVKRQHQHFKKIKDCVSAIVLLMQKTYIFRMERCVYLVTRAHWLSDASPWASCSQAALTLGHSPEQQLLAAVKLTRADVTVLLVHTVHCLWSGHVEGWHACRNTRTHELREGGGWGKKSQCPQLRLTPHSPPQRLRNLLHFNKTPSSEFCHFNICLLFSFGINVRLQTRENALAGASYSCFSLWISYGYLCRRLSNADFVWQVSIEGLGSNWSTNRKQKIEMAERNRGGN